MSHSAIRLLYFWNIIVTAMLLIAMTTGTRQSIRDHIQARQLTIVDQAGIKVLTMDKDGLTLHRKINDTFTLPSAMIVNGPNGGIMTVINSKMLAVASLETSINNGGVLLLRNSSNKNVVELGATMGGGGLRLFDDAGEMRLAVGIIDGNGNLATVSHEGKAAVFP